MITIIKYNKAPNEIRGTGTEFGHAYRLTQSVFGDSPVRGNIFIRAKDSLISLSKPGCVRDVSGGDLYVEVDLEITVKEKD